MRTTGPTRDVDELPCLRHDTRARLTILLVQGVHVLRLAPAKPEALQDDVGVFCIPWAWDLGQGVQEYLRAQENATGHEGQEGKPG